jgi:Rod binding domain-containing protein
MDIGAISIMGASDAAGKLPASSPKEMASEFEALFWEMLVKESHLFQIDESESGDSAGMQIGSLVEQILASHLAKGLELGLGRAVLVTNREKIA